MPEDGRERLLIAGGAGGLDLERARRACVEVIDLEPSSRGAERVSINQRGGELALAYQPQISVASGRIVSVEALLRWSSPAHGNVPSSRFIVLAERTGLVDRLTHWVVIQALEAQVRWRRDGVELPVSVNLSAKTLRLPDLATWILAELEKRCLPDSALTVEVTETAAVDLFQAVNLLRPLHEQGSGSPSTTSERATRHWPRSRTCRWMRSRST